MDFNLESFRITQKIEIQIPGLKVLAFGEPEEIFISSQAKSSIEQKDQPVAVSRSFPLIFHITLDGTKANNFLIKLFASKADLKPPLGPVIIQLNEEKGTLQATYEFAERYTDYETVSSFPYSIRAREEVVPLSYASKDQDIYENSTAGVEKTRLSPTCISKDFDTETLSHTIEMLAECNNLEPVLSYLKERFSDFFRKALQLIRDKEEQKIQQAEKDALATKSKVAI